LRRDFDKGVGLAKRQFLYDAARVVGEQVRRVSDLDRAALERDDYKFNVNFILGGQIQGEDAGIVYDLSAGQSPPGDRSNPPTCRSARPNTGGPFWTAAFNMSARRWRTRPSTRCCRSIPR
jgi:hypothetical protein